MQVPCTVQFSWLPVRTVKISVAVIQELFSEGIPQQHLCYPFVICTLAMHISWELKQDPDGT